MYCCNLQLFPHKYCWLKIFNKATFLTIVMKQIGSKVAIIYLLFNLFRIQSCKQYSFLVFSCFLFNFKINILHTYEIQISTANCALTDLFGLLLTSKYKERGMNQGSVSNIMGMWAIQNVLGGLYVTVLSYFAPPRTL